MTKGRDSALFFIMPKTEILQVTTTLASRDEAERVGRVLVEERLAACAQIVGPLTSFYWWQQKLESASEWHCHLKTTAERFPALATRLRALHSYDLPEIIAVSVEQAGADYAGWVARTVCDPAS